MPNVSQVYVEAMEAALYRLHERVERIDRYIPNVRKVQLRVTYRKPEEQLPELTYEVEIIVGAGAQQFIYTAYAIDDMYKKLLEPIRLLRPRYEECTDIQKQMLHDQL